MAIVANTNGSIFPLSSQFGTLLVGLDVDIGSIGYHFFLKVSKDDISETLSFCALAFYRPVDIQSAQVKMIRTQIGRRRTCHRAATVHVISLWSAKTSFSGCS
jgi:hypothetical protein